MGLDVPNTVLLSAAEVEIQAAGSSPSVSIVAYTGGLMSVPGWGPVAIDLAGLDAGGDQVGLLADHDATLGGIVGHGRATVADGKLVVRGTLVPTTDAARRVIELARAGFRFQASVGVAPTDTERVRPGETVVVNGRSVKAPAGGFTLVKAGTLREVSIVALGADADTSVAIAAHRKDVPMNELQTVDAIRTAAAAEAERIHAIRAACGGRFGDIEVRAIREGWDGLLRAGETMNVIAASKVGKSWLVTDLALSVATGRPWLGEFETSPGRVLVVDNELHRETTAHRIPKVMEARGLTMSDTVDRLFVANVRGELKDVISLGACFRSLEPGRFQLIVLDAFYRFMPKDADENDNGTMARVYNHLDQYAAMLGCAFVLVHHSTKGNQSGKAVTDVGAGAGSQSRATDMVISTRKENTISTRKENTGGLGTGHFFGFDAFSVFDFIDSRNR